MIVHQAPGEAGSPMRRACLRNQQQIGAAVLIGKEDRQSAIATLSHVVRHGRDDNAGEASHGREIAEEKAGG